LADYNELAKNINAAIQAIKDKFAPRIAELQQRGMQMKDDFKKPSDVGAMIGVDFNVEWKEVDIIFDVPSVTIKQQSLKFDLPETTMTLQTLSWDMPAICMKYVEFPCGGGFHVPEPCMKRQEIKLHLPEFTMKTQEIIMGIPEFTMERVKWRLGLPQFKVTNVSAEVGKIKDKGAALQADGEALAGEMKAEVDAAVAAAYGGGGSAEVKAKYDDSLLKVSAGIDSLLQAGIDPIKAPTADGNVNLRKQYEDLMNQRNQALAALEGQGIQNPEGKPLVRIEPAAA